MSTSEVIAAFLAFLLGLLAKFLYDLWVESRQKKALVFTKKLVSSFSISSLGANLRERTEVLFDKQPVASVQVVSVEVENSGRRAVKNQSFTVRFGERASILGTPKNLSASEDFRYVQEEKVTGTENAYRYVIKLLQKNRKLQWEFAVINNEKGEFSVEHGIASTKEDFSDADLDVGSVVVSSKAQLDLMSQIRRTLLFLVSIAIVSVVAGPAIAAGGSLVAIALTAIIVLLLFLLYRSAVNAIQLFADSFKLSDLIKPRSSVEILNGTFGDLSVAGRDIITATPVVQKASSDILDMPTDIIDVTVEKNEIGSQQLEKALVAPNEAQQVSE